MFKSILLKWFSQIQGSYEIYLNDDLIEDPSISGRLPKFEAIFIKNEFWEMYSQNGKNCNKQQRPN